MFKTIFSFFVLQGVFFASAAEDSFLFNQCECQTFDFFPTINRGGNLSPINTTGNGLDCIPEKLGVVRDYAGDIDNDMSFSISTDFFVDQAFSRLFWFMLFNVDLSEAVLDQLYSIAVIEFPLITVEISLQITSTQLVVFLNQVSTAIERNPTDEYTVLLAEINDGNSKLVLLPAPSLFLVIPAELNLGTVNIIGEAADFFAPVNVRLLNTDNANDGRIRLEMVGLDNNFNGLTAAFVLSLNSASIIASFIDIDVPALPLFDVAQTLLAGEEDQAISNVSFADAILPSAFVFDFNIDLTFSKGFAFFQLGNTLIYIPAPDDFGFDFFLVGYTPLAGQLPYECTLFIPFSVEIAPVEDIPFTIFVDILEFFQGVNNTFSEIVAFSVDFPEANNTLLEGAVVIESLPIGDLRTFDCATPLQVGSLVQLVDGKFNFCYFGSLLTTFDEFTYSVLPPSLDVNNRALDLGTISLLEKEPIDDFSEDEGDVATGVGFVIPGLAICLALTGCVSVSF